MVMRFVSTLLGAIRDNLKSFFSLNDEVIITNKSSFKCKRCGKIYSDPDSPAICGDWDMILGPNRKN
jgi:hypothetical protein